MSTTQQKGHCAPISVVRIERREGVKIDIRREPSAY